MDGDCIALRRHLASDPRTLRISATLALEPATVVGTLFLLGAYASIHGVADGDETPDTINRRFIPLLDARMLDVLLGIDGLAVQLDEVDWVHFRKDGITIDGAGWCEFALSHDTRSAR